MRLPNPAAGIRTLLVETAVVILTYNHPEHSSRAAHSVLALEQRNIIMVHNGSEERHITLLQKRFPTISHLILPSNRGYSGGINAGLTKAFTVCSWALVLTNDSMLVSFPNIPLSPAVIAPLIFRRQTSIVDSAGGLFSPKKGRLRHCKSAFEFEDGAKDEKKYIPGTCFLVHKEVFQVAGPLRDELCIYWDDVEWSQRVIHANFPLIVDEHWRVRHGGGKTAAKNPLYSLYYFQRNRKTISWEFCPPRARLMLICILFWDWVKLLLKNVRKRRWEALPFLWQAMIR